MGKTAPDKATKGTSRSAPKSYQQKVSKPAVPPSRAEEELNVLKFAHALDQASQSEYNLAEGNFPGFTSPEGNVANSPSQAFAATPEGTDFGISDVENMGFTNAHFAQDPAVSPLPIDPALSAPVAGAQDSAVSPLPIDPALSAPVADAQDPAVSPLPIDPALSAPVAGAQEDAIMYQEDINKLGVHQPSIAQEPNPPPAAQQLEPSQNQTLPVTQSPGLSLAPPTESGNGQSTIRTAMEVARASYGDCDRFHMARIQTMGKAAAKRLPNPRQGREAREPNYVNKASPDAILIQLSGDVVEEPCFHCSKSQGPFEECVVKKGQLQNSCANCWYGGSGTRCTFHKKNNPEKPIPTFSTIPMIAGAPRIPADLAYCNIARRTVETINNAAFGEGMSIGKAILAHLEFCASTVAIQGNQLALTVSDLHGTAKAWEMWCTTPEGVQEMERQRAAASNETKATPQGEVSGSSHPAPQVEASAQGQPDTDQVQS